MEKVKFVDPDTGESLGVFCGGGDEVGGTALPSGDGIEEDGDCDAYILKELSETRDEESVYVLVEDDTELAGSRKSICRSCSTTRTLHFKRQITNGGNSF